MASVPHLAFSHIGFHVTNLEPMERFYTEFMGFTITDRGELDTAIGKQKFVFLSRDPKEHHQVVLATGRPGDLKFNPINQLSFRVDGFADLREMHSRLVASEKSGQISELRPVTHGNALSLYFRDPEGNRIELFMDSPWYVDQPMRVPMDMSLSDEALWKWAEQHARSLPGFVPIEEWRDRVEKKMKAN